jgi:hypothetical protein
LKPSSFSLYTTVAKSAAIQVELPASRPSTIVLPFCSNTQQSCQIWKGMLLVLCFLPTRSGAQVSVYVRQSCRCYCCCLQSQCRCNHASTPAAAAAGGSGDWTRISPLPRLLSH